MPNALVFQRGQRFGHLTILEVTDRRDGGAVLWRCQCDCGREALARAGGLSSGSNRSCGCAWRLKLMARNYRHGDYGSRLYRVWSMLRDRCGNPNARDFRNFGGRGVRLCEAWGDYSGFRAWALSHGYPTDLSIQLIDRTGNFEPANCCWAKAYNYRTPNKRRAGVTSAPAAKSPGRRRKVMEDGTMLEADTG